MVPVMVKVFVLVHGDMGGSWTQAPDPLSNTLSMGGREGETSKGVCQLPDVDFSSAHVGSLCQRFLCDENRLESSVGYFYINIWTQLTLKYKLTFHL